METDLPRDPDLHAAVSNKERLAREIRTRVADKWTLLVVGALSTGGELRFSRLRERIGGISQKMLAKTLRQMERDGLVTRRVHAVVPPRVDYRLTPLGEQLGASISSLWVWVEGHLDDVEHARAVYDRASARTPS